MKTTPSVAPSMELLRTHAIASPSASAGKEAALAWQREMERAQTDAWFSGSLPAPTHFGGRPAGGLHAGEDFRGAVVSGSPSRREGRGGRTNAAAPRAGATGAHAAGQAYSVTDVNDGSCRGRAQPSTTSNKDSGRNNAAPPSAEHAAQGMAAEVSSTVHYSSPTLPTPVVHVPANVLGAVASSAAIPLSTAMTVSVPRPSGEGAESVTASDLDRAALAGRLVTPTPDGAGVGAGEQLSVRVHIEHGASGPTVWFGVDSEALVQLPALTQAMARWLAAAGYASPTWICNGQPWRPSPAGNQAGPDGYFRTAEAPQSSFGTDHAPISSLTHTGTHK